MRFRQTRRILSGAILLALAAVSAFAADLAVHDANLPAFTLSDLQGKPHSLDEYRGKVVLVNFWASWCPPCIREIPALVDLGRQLADEPFEIIAINVGEQKFRVWKFTRMVNFDVPVLLDTEQQTFEDWNVMTLPTSFLLDRDGRARYRVQGVPEWDSEETLSVIRELLRQENNAAGRQQAGYVANGAEDHLSQ